MRKAEIYLTDNAEIEKGVYRFCKSLNADQSLIGYKYFVFAIFHMMNEPNEEVNYTGKDGIYQKIADKYQSVSASSVERAIRHFAHRIYDRRPSDELYLEIFGELEKLSNRKFLNDSLNYIRYEILMSNDEGNQS